MDGVTRLEIVIVEDKVVVIAVDADGDAETQVDTRADADTNALPDTLGLPL